MKFKQLVGAFIYFTTLCLSAYLWIFKKGPFIDTSFELNVLQESDSFSSYLDLIKSDNQPPVQKILTFLLFQTTGQSMGLTRFITAVILGTLIYTLFTQYVRKMGDKEVQFSQILFITLIVGISPSIMSAITIQRYSSSAAVIWLATVLLALVAQGNRSSKAVLLSGFLVSLALSISYTSLVLGLVILLFYAISNRRQIHLFVIGCLPGVTVMGSWFIFAGPIHQELVIGKSSMPLSRQVGALWENLFWPVFGPVTLPSIFFTALLIVLFFGFFMARIRLVNTAKVSIFMLILQFVLPMFVFSYAGLANANMAGPTLVLATYFSAHQEKLKNTLRLWLSRIAFSAVVVACTFSLFFNYNVLRPYYWSNASLAVVRDLESSAKSEPLQLIALSDLNIKTLLRYSDRVTVFDLNDESISLPRPLRGDYFLWSDEIDKSQNLLAFKNEIGNLGYSLVLIKSYGPFTQTSIRTSLGMYNTKGSQYYLYRISK